jgi:murein DD-endopeptidase MepM/ murein hydrolase activator NlpD
MHNGTDFPAPAHTPIYAVAAGTVVKSKVSGHPSGGYGEFIQIDHGDGIHSLYAHMSSGTRKVKVGDRVSPGQHIGGVGTTGLSTGNHLHFEIRVNGKFVDPMKYIKNSSVVFKPSPNNFKAYHVVRPGDTLWKIAKDHNMTLDQLRALNKIKSHLIFPGQKIKIVDYKKEEAIVAKPAKPAKPVVPAKPAPTKIVVHTVKRGDTLWGISRKHKVTVAQLRKLNGITGSTIYPGQKIIVKK